MASGMKIQLPTQDQNEEEEDEDDEGYEDEQQAARDRVGQLIDRFLANLDSVYQSAVGENYKVFDDASASLKKANMEICAPLKEKARMAESSSIKSYLLDIIDYLQDVLIHKQIVTARKILHNPFDERAHEFYWKILQEVTNRSRQALEAADDINDLADDEWLDQHEQDVGDEATPAEFLLSIVAKEWAQLLRAAKRGNAQKVEEFIESCAQANQEATELILAEEATAAGIEEATKQEIQMSTTYLAELLGEAYEIARMMCAPGVDAALQDYFKAYDVIMEDMMEHVNDVITFTSEAEEEQNGIVSLAAEEKENLKLLLELFANYIKSIQENSLMGVESFAEEILRLVRQIINDAEELSQEIEETSDRRAVQESSGELAGLVMELESLRKSKKAGDDTYAPAAGQIQKEMQAVLVNLYKLVAKQRKREAESGARKRTALQAQFKKEKTVHTELMRVIKKLSKEKAGPTKKKLEGDFKKLMSDLKAARERVGELRQRSDQKKKRILAFRKRKHRKAREDLRVKKLDLYEQLSEQLRLEKEQMQRERDTACRRWYEYKRNMVTPQRRKELRMKREAEAAAAAAAIAEKAAAASQPPPSAAPPTDGAASSASIPIPPADVSASAGAASPMTSRAPGMPLSSSVDSAGGSPSGGIPRTMSSSMDFSRAGGSPLRLSASMGAEGSPQPLGALTTRGLSSSTSEPGRHVLPLHQSPMGALLPDKSVMMTARRMDSSPNLNAMRDPNVAPSFTRPESNLTLIANLPKPGQTSLLPSLSGLMRQSSSGSLGSLGTLGNGGTPPAYAAPAGSSPPAFQTSPPAFHAAPPTFHASPPAFKAATNGPPVFAAGTTTTVIERQLPKSQSQSSPSLLKPVAPGPMPMTAAQVAQNQAHDQQQHIQAAHRKQMLLLKRKAMAKNQGIEPVTPPGTNGDGKPLGPRGLLR